MGAMYSSLLKNLILPFADKIMKTRIKYFYDEIRKMQNYSKEQIEEWQNKALRNLISHSYNHTRYYKELFDSNKIHPFDIKNINDLKVIPQLTKDIIRNSYDDLLADNLKSYPYKISATGGSTGNPLQFLLDLDSWSYIVANTIIYWEKTEYRYGDKYIAIGSTSLFIDDHVSLKHRLYYKMKNKTGLNGVNMSDSIVSSYVDLIKNKNIRFLYGYASGIYLIAKYVRKHAVKLNIKAVFPTSEVLTDLYRQTIIEGFNCIIMDEYGAHDGGIIAFETSIDQYEVGYNSLVRLKTIENSIGDVLLTNLLNYSMPFINYQLGDRVELYSSNDPGTYNGQLIKNVFGRDSNLIFLENGNILTGPGFTILFKDLSVESYMISKTGINSICITIKKLQHYSQKDENTIISTFKKNAGDDCTLQINYVEDFEMTPSGKRTYFYTE